MGIGKAPPHLPDGICAEAFVTPESSGGGVLSLRGRRWETGLALGGEMLPFNPGESKN